MCKHVFNYREDIQQNYNSDKETLTGTCRYCGAKEKALGYWGVEANFSDKIRDALDDEPQFILIDNWKIMC